LGRQAKAGRAGRRGGHDPRGTGDRRMKNDKTGEPHARSGTEQAEIVSPAHA
jgi:hypothetical protein